MIGTDVILTYCSVSLHKSRSTITTWDPTDISNGSFTSAAWSSGMTPLFSSSDSRSPKGNGWETVWGGSEASGQVCLMACCVQSSLKIKSTPLMLLTDPRCPRESGSKCFFFLEQKPIDNTQHQLEARIMQIHTDWWLMMIHNATLRFDPIQCVVIYVTLQMYHNIVLWMSHMSCCTAGVLRTTWKRTNCWLIVNQNLNCRL